MRLAELSRDRQGAEQKHRLRAVGFFQHLNGAIKVDSLDENLDEPRRFSPKTAGKLADGSGLDPLGIKAATR